jgi:hypothetical protein
MYASPNICHCDLIKDGMAGAWHVAHMGDPDHSEDIGVDGKIIVG